MMRNKLLRDRLSVLRDSRGISLSMPETIVGTVLKYALFTGMASVIAGMFAFTFTTASSTQASAGFQNANTRFAAEVAASDVIKGNGATAVALMRTNGSKCDISLWADASVDGTRTLVVEKTSVTGACTAGTAIPARSATSRTALVGDIAVPQVTFENIAGRTITFNSAGNASVAPGSRPAGVASQDWDDLRPQKVEMKLASEKSHVTASAKKGSLIGFAEIVNFAEAPTGASYVPPADPVVPTYPVAGVKVVRSTTAGTAYYGAREGVRVSFDGGQCHAQPTQVTITWQATWPTGLAPVSTAFTQTLTGTTVSRDLAGVPNGATGNVTVAAKCQPAAEPETASRMYTQTVPTTSVAVSQSSPVERHNLSWGKVSSLPATYTLYVTGPAGNDSVGNIKTESTTYTHRTGAVYGQTSYYSVEATVGDDKARSGVVSIANTWPATPAVSGISYSSVGTVSANVAWNNPVCPAGTDLYTQEIQNKRGRTDGVYETGNWTVGSWVKGKRTAVFGPGYAMQGYPYSYKVNTKCVSTVTGAESPVATAQGGDFYTAMNTPATPAWNAYNYVDGTRGTNRTYHTCREPGYCGSRTDSIKLDWVTYCSPGSWVSNSYQYGRAPAWGATYGYTIGEGDGWQIAGNYLDVWYGGARYICSTPWRSTAWSPTSGERYVLVYKNRWW